jgi:hypothetical protein
MCATRMKRTGHVTKPILNTVKHARYFKYLSHCSDIDDDLRRGGYCSRLLDKIFRG